MSLEKITLWLGIPGLIVGAALALGTLFGVFGFQIKTPEQSLQEHVAEFVNFRTDADSFHNIEQKTVREELKHVEGLAILPIRRSCVRDSYDELAVQGFLPYCQELGINRRPNDRGTREAASTGQPVDLEISSPPPSIELAHPDSLFGPDTTGA